MQNGSQFQAKLKNAVIGNVRDISDKSVFHKISLIAFFAWVGLGSDPLSSSCYGPEEIMRNLQGHSNLAIMVGMLTVITLSISSGADAIFSFLPAEWHQYKLLFAFTILTLLMVLNHRGVRESVMVLTPIFIMFVLTHLILIGIGIFGYLPEAGNVVDRSVGEMSNTVSQLGIFGTMMLMLRAYSMGAGTYTGIEAVSNGIPNLREPKVQTAQKTMILLSVSLTIAAFGLIISYYLFDIQFTFSQFGMVKQWIQVRSEETKWFRKMMVNGIGLIMTTSILITVVTLKFREGGIVFN